MNNKVVLRDRDGTVFTVVRDPLDTFIVGLDGHSVKTINFQWIIEETGNVVPHEYFSQLNIVKVGSVLGSRDQSYTVLEYFTDML